MKLEGYLISILAVGFVIVVAGLFVTDMNNYYTGISNVSANNTLWEGKYISYSDDINASISGLQEKIAILNDAEAGYIEKILAGGGLVAKVVLFVPSVIMSGLGDGVSIATEVGTNLGVPPIITQLGIVLLGIIITFAVIKWVRSII